MRGLATFVQEAMEITRVWNLAYPKSKLNLNMDAFAFFVQIAVDKGSSHVNGAEMLPHEYAACVQEVTHNG